MRRHLPQDNTQMPQENMDGDDQAQERATQMSAEGRPSHICSLQAGFGPHHTAPSPKVDIPSTPRSLCL